MSRTPITRVPSGGLGATGAVKAQPFGSGAAFGGHSGGFGRFSSFGLGFDGGDLRHGSILLNGFGLHGHGGRGHSVYGDHGGFHGGGFHGGLHDGLHGGHHGGLFGHSVYGQLYYDHRYHFYGPYQAYWSTAYYPHYSGLYGLGFDHYGPSGYYTYGSPYYAGPYEATVYDETAEVVPGPDDVGAVAVETAPGAVEQTPYEPAIAGPPAASETAETSDLQTEGWGPLLGEGNVAFSQGRFDEARRIYARAMLIDERDGYAKMLFAWANFALGDYSLAATALRRALLTSPDLLKFPIDIRLHYGDLHALDSQIESLKTYLAQNASDREARLILGYLLYSVGDAKGALDVFVRLATEDPNDQTAASLRDAAQNVVKLLQNAPPADQAPNKPQ